MSKGGQCLDPIHPWIWGFGVPAEGWAQPRSSLWMLRHNPAHVWEKLASAAVRMTCSACSQYCTVQGFLKQGCWQSLELRVLLPARLPWALPAPSCAPLPQAPIAALRCAQGHCWLQHLRQDHCFPTTSWRCKHLALLLPPRDLCPWQR